MDGPWMEWGTPGTLFSDQDPTRAQFLCDQTGAMRSCTNCCCWHMVVSWRHRTVVCMAFLGLPRIIKHGNGKSPLNGHLSGKIICEYICVFFPLQCLMNYQGIQFAISPSGGGFACSNVFHPTILLNGCIYILIILP